MSKLVVYSYSPTGALKQRKYVLASGDRPQDIISVHGTKKTAVRVGEKLARKTGILLTVED